MNESLRGKPQEHVEEESIPVHRPARFERRRPAAPTFSLQPFPSPGEPPRLSLGQFLLPLLGSGTILIYGLVAKSELLAIIGGLVVLVALITPLVLHFINRNARNRQYQRNISLYEKYLTTVEGKVAEYKTQLTRYQHKVTPSVELLRVWIADPTISPQVGAPTLRTPKASIVTWSGICRLMRLLTNCWRVTKFHARYKDQVKGVDDVVGNF